jgi:hypothetical protein
VGPVWTVSFHISGRLPLQKHLLCGPILLSAEIGPFLSMDPRNLSDLYKEGDVCVGPVWTVSFHISGRLPLQKHLLCGPILLSAEIGPFFTPVISCKNEIPF